MSKIFIGVAGNIGTGKTTFTRMLAEGLGGEAHFESVADNPYLSDFYGDMPRWSFNLQIYFLNSRFAAHRDVFKNANVCVQDRTIYEDANIFAPALHRNGQMSARDYANYKALYESMIQILQPPSLIVYLRKSIPQLRKNIERRGREYERGIPDSYLELLNEHYEDWIERYPHKKLVIDSDSLDFVASKNDFNYLFETVSRHLP